MNLPDTHHEISLINHSIVRPHAAE
jgi:hypothetical protein